MSSRFLPLSVFLSLHRSPRHAAGECCPPLPWSVPKRRQFSVRNQGLAPHGERFRSMPLFFPLAFERANWQSAKGNTRFLFFISLYPPGCFSAVTPLPTRRLQDGKALPPETKGYTPADPAPPLAATKNRKLRKRDIGVLSNLTPFPFHPFENWKLRDKRLKQGEDCVPPSCL